MKKKIKSKAHAGVPASQLGGQKGLFSSDGTAKPVCECCKSEPCVCVFVSQLAGLAGLGSSSPKTRMGSRSARISLLVK